MATTSKSKRHYRDQVGRTAVRTLRLDRIHRGDAYCTVVRIEQDGKVTHPNKPVRMTLRRLTGRDFVPLESAAEATALEGGQR